MSTEYVIPPPPQAAVKVAGIDQDVSGAAHLVRRAQLSRAHQEMGQDEREPPFFFAKPADAIVHDGGTVPYPPLTNDLHHEVEMVVALKSRRPQHPEGQGARLRVGLRRRHRPDAARPADRLAQHQAAVGDRQGVRRLGAVRAAASRPREIGHPQKGRIYLKVNGEVKQDGDLEQMIWNVPEIIWKLSEMVALDAGDIIMTGTPAGVSALQPGHKLECEVEGVGKVSVTIGPKA